ncbi:MAG: hypothetical protein LBQ32_05530 [Burkholderiaceae bacterium]|jgi:hypothetical protein|nr:hypothetical protein [Burkholderiaceae bacterium]
MSDANVFDFGKFIPGFDFLQQLAAPRTGGVAAPGLGGWIAPTVSVEELERRIQELKAVQFWLDQNCTAVKATIQALEVQKMTLATLESMNLGITEVAKAFTLPTGDAAMAKPADTPAPAPAPEPPEPAAHKPAARPRKPATHTPPKPADTGLADPMQWWSALTQQFQHIAANALREAGSAAPAANSEGAGTGQAAAGGAKETKKVPRGKRAPVHKKAGAVAKKSQTGG